MSNILPIAKGHVLSDNNTLLYIDIQIVNLKTFKKWIKKGVKTFLYLPIEIVVDIVSNRLSVIKEDNALTLNRVSVIDIDKYLNTNSTKEPSLEALPKEYREFEHVFSKATLNELLPYRLGIDYAIILKEGKTLLF